MEPAGLGLPFELGILFELVLSLLLDGGYLGNFRTNFLRTCLINSAADRTMMDYTDLVPTLLSNGYSKTVGIRYTEGGANGTESPPLFIIGNST